MLDTTGSALHSWANSEFGQHIYNHPRAHQWSGIQPQRSGWVWGLYRNSTSPTATTWAFCFERGKTQEAELSPSLSWERRYLPAPGTGLPVLPAAAQPHSAVPPSYTSGSLSDILSEQPGQHHRRWAGQALTSAALHWNTKHTETIRPTLIPLQTPPFTQIGSNSRHRVPYQQL